MRSPINRNHLGYYSKFIAYLLITILIFSFGNSIPKIKGNLKPQALKSSLQYETSIPLTNDSQVVIDGSITSGEYEGTYYEPTTQIMVYWEHDSNNLSVGLVSPGLGWVSLGVGSSKFGGNIIFGGSDGGSSYCYDQTGQPDYSHPNDTTLGGTNDIVNFEAVENATHTTLEFIIPLNSTDSLDPVMQVSETIDMFFAYHATSDDTQQLGHIHSNYVTVLIRSAVTTIQTSIIFTAPSSVMQGENFTIQATLLDENQNPINNKTLEFFRLTEIQPFYLIINAVSSDDLGKASVTFSSPDLSGNHSFGVRFTQVEINNTYVYERKEVSSTIIFIVEENGEEDPVKKFLFLVIEFSVWLTLAAIVCIYLFIIYNLIRITTNKSPSHTENEIAAKKENSK